MDSLSFAPVARPVDADDLGTVGETDRQDAATNFAEAVVPLFT
jgi:hypothetical protein